MRYSNSVTNFREKYRKENIATHYNGLLHFIFTSAWCISIITACICLTDQVSWKEWLILPFTFIYTNFI